MTKIGSWPLTGRHSTKPDWIVSGLITYLNVASGDLDPLVNNLNEIVLPGVTKFNGVRKLIIFDQNKHCFVECWGDRMIRVFSTKLSFPFLRDTWSDLLSSLKCLNDINQIVFYAVNSTNKTRKKAIKTPFNTSLRHSPVQS